MVLLKKIISFNADFYFFSVGAAIHCFITIYYDKYLTKTFM